MASTYPTSLDTFTNPSALSPLTSPSHAQQHSDINDAMEAVQTKLAIGNTVIGTYTAFTPTFVNLTVGNGTSSAKFSRVNNVVDYYGYFILGSTSAVTGVVNITLPITANAIYAGINGIPMGDLSMYDTTASTWYKGEVFSISSATVTRTRIWTTSGSNIISNSSPNATAPMTWATGDQFLWNIRYEAA
jgi:hypothetical protein